MDISHDLHMNNDQCVILVFFVTKSAKHVHVGHVLKGTV